jgi:hypothetical protein
MVVELFLKMLLRRAPVEAKTCLSIRTMYVLNVVDHALGLSHIPQVKKEILLLLQPNNMWPITLGIGC